MGNMMITSGNRMRIWYIEGRLGRCCQFRWDGKIQHIRSSLFSGGSMNHNSIAEADFYIVSNTFQILEYNAVLSRKKPSVQKGDLCYKAFMNQDQPCKYCPLVYASKQSSHVFFDPERHCWMEAVFASLDGHRTAVTCRQIHGQAGTLFHRLQSGKKDLQAEQNLYRNSLIGVIGAYWTEQLPVYYVNDAMVSMLGFKTKMILLPRLAEI